MNDKKDVVYTVWYRGEHGYYYDFAGDFTSIDDAELSVDNLDLYTIEEWRPDPRPVWEEEAPGHPSDQWTVYDE